MRIRAAWAVCVTSGLLTACVSNTALEQRVAQLEARVQHQEDVESLRRLAFSYGYYMDNALMDQIEGLMADQMDYCEIAGYGVYRGRQGCISIWRNILGPGLQNEDGRLKFGRLIKHYLVKDIVTVNPDGRTAQGRFDYIGYSGIFRQPEHTTQQLGVYRFGFIKERGVWKIYRFDLTFDTSDWNYSTWATSTSVRCPRPNAPPPDAPAPLHHPFPEVATAPFSDPNPVTGQVIPDYVNPQHYWQGNWPGEPAQPCGARP
jgi:SnoaL-like domain